MKKFTAFLMVFIFAVCSASFNAFGARTTATAAFGDMGITINGEEYDARPLIINGTSYFPVRTLAYALNCSVEWNNETKNIYITSQSEPVEEETYSQTKDGTYGTKTAIFDDDVAVYANGKLVDTPVAIVDDRSYVPIKQIAEALGKRATWYSDTRTIEIVNPETAVVDDSIKDYYIYDLPEITSEEDYIVGNWKGYLNFKSGYVEEVELFISKNLNEATGYENYYVVERTVVVESPDNPAEVGNCVIRHGTTDFNAARSEFFLYLCDDNYENIREISYKLENEVIYAYEDWQNFFSINSLIESSWLRRF